MQHSFKQIDNALQVQLSGRMTHADHRSFRDILTKVTQDNPRRVVFDLGHVEFIDSSALGMLLIVRDACLQQNRVIALKNATGQVEKLTKVAKLHKYFEVE